LKDSPKLFQESKNGLPRNQKFLLLKSVWVKIKALYKYLKTGREGKSRDVTTPHTHLHTV
jgi:hypothetical protein